MMDKSQCWITDSMFNYGQHSNHLNSPCGNFIPTEMNYNQQYTMQPLQILPTTFSFNNSEKPKGNVFYFGKEGESKKKNATNHRKRDKMKINTTKNQNTKHCQSFNYFVKQGKDIMNYLKLKQHSKTNLKTKYECYVSNNIKQNMCFENGTTTLCSEINNKNTDKFISENKLNESKNSDNLFYFDTTPRLLENIYIFYNKLNSICILEEIPDSLNSLKAVNTKIIENDLNINKNTDISQLTFIKLHAGEKKNPKNDIEFSKMNYLFGTDRYKIIENSEMFDFSDVANIKNTETTNLLDEEMIGSSQFDNLSDASTVILDHVHDIIILSDTEDDVVEIPKSPPPIVCIRDSDDEDTAEIKDKMIPEDLQSETCESVFISPALTPKKQKSVVNIDSRMSTPDSFSKLSDASIDDFIMNDFSNIEIQTENNLPITRNNIKKVKYLKKVVDNNLSMGNVYETESTCSDIFDFNTVDKETCIDSTKRLKKKTRKRKRYEEIDLASFDEYITPNKKNTTMNNTKQMGFIPVKSRSLEIKETPSKKISISSKLESVQVDTKLNNTFSTDTSESEFSEMPEKVVLKNKNKNLKSKKDIYKKKLHEDVGQVLVSKKNKKKENSVSVINNKIIINNNCSTNHSKTIKQINKLHNKSDVTDANINILKKNCENLTKSEITLENSEEMNKKSFISDNELECLLSEYKSNTNCNRVYSEVNIMMNIDCTDLKSTNISTCIDLTSENTNIQQNVALDSDLSNKSQTFENSDSIWNMNRNDYYNLTSSEKFNMDGVLMKMTKDPNAWLAPLDKGRRRPEPKLRIRCANCRQWGHRQRLCPKPLKACSYCRNNTHREYNCPYTCCLNCLTPSATGSYVMGCANCMNVYCNRCRQWGHTVEFCHQLWRRYHSTIKPGPLVPACHPLKQNQLWCSGCGKRGHLCHNCYIFKTQSWLPLFNPLIHHYEEIYCTNDNPPQKRRKLDDTNEFDSWNIHKVLYDKSTNVICQYS